MNCSHVLPVFAADGAVTYPVGKGIGQYSSAGYPRSVPWLGWNPRRDVIPFGRGAKREVVGEIPSWDMMAVTPFSLARSDIVSKHESRLTTVRLLRDSEEPL